MEESREKGVLIIEHSQDPNNKTSMEYVHNILYK